MALKDRYIRPDTRTKLEKWIDTLKPEHKTVILDWLTDGTISNVRIVEMIHDDDEDEGFTGYRANKDTIAAWRRTHGTR